MFFATPGRTAGLLSLQIAGRLVQGNAPRCFELLTGAKNGARRNKDNQQDRSLSHRRSARSESEPQLFGERLCGIKVMLDPPETRGDK